MASDRSLQDMPQLVLEKIVSFLNHKQLLALEQASKTLKCIVDDYFVITDHISIGYLPLNHQPAVDGLAKLILRCGARLRIIEIDISDQFYDNPLKRCEPYFRRIFETVGNKCPNIERIITSQQFINVEEDQIFNRRNIALTNEITDVYATQIYESTGTSCKLRSVTLLVKDEAQQGERILQLYPKLQQILLVHGIGNGNQFHNNFIDFLPRFIENGLKDLKFCLFLCNDPEIISKIWKIGKNLKTLFAAFPVSNDVQIASINKMQYSKNVTLRLLVIPRVISFLNENVCKSVVECYVFDGGDDYSSLVRMENLKTCIIHDVKTLRVIAQGSFPKLTKIRLGSFMSKMEHECDNSCEMQTPLHQLLTDKGHQLLKICLDVVCSSDALLLVLKYCKAAIIIEIKDVQFGNALNFEDVLAVFELPNLQRLSIGYEGDELNPVYELLKRAATQNRFQIINKINPLKKVCIFARNL